MNICSRNTMSHIGFRYTYCVLCADVLSSVYITCDFCVLTFEFRVLIFPFVFCVISFGHVSRSSGLAKTILQCTVKGKRKGGRQKKRWEDNIKEWTGMDFASSTRAAENRSRWKGIVANSSVVPQRPSKVMG